MFPYLALHVLTSDEIIQIHGAMVTILEKTGFIVEKATLKELPPFPVATHGIVV